MSLLEDRAWLHTGAACRRCLAVHGYNQLVRFRGSFPVTLQAIITLIVLRLTFEISLNVRWLRTRDRKRRK